MPFWQHYIYAVLISKVGGSMKKRHLIYGLIFLCILLHFTYVWFSKGRSVSYVINKDDIKFNIKESYTKNYKNEYPNYYIEITVDKNTFNLEVSDSFSSTSYIVDDVKYFENDTYTCVLPIFNGEKIMSDILCLKDSVLYHYTDLQNESLELDKFASSIQKTIPEDSSILVMNNLKLYTDNLDKNIYLVLSNYHGIDIIHSKKLETISLFKNDIYTQKIKTQVGKYYVVADYNESHDFHEFYRVDITTKKVSKIISEAPISFDSYIQGIIGDVIYLFDKEAKKQYKIDVKNKTVILNGTIKTGIEQYDDGTFRNINAYEAYTNEILFDIYPSKNVESSKIVRVGNKYSGYNYMYTPLNTGEYIVSQFHVQNNKIKTYAFATSDISRIFYTTSGIYYIDEDTLNYYNPLYGVKPLLKNNEWKFNTSLFAYAYEK